MKKLKGFTLVELLVVIAVIGILSAVVVLNTNSAKDKAKEANMKTNMTGVQTVATICADETGGKLLASDTYKEVVTGGTAADTVKICTTSSSTLETYSKIDAGYFIAVKNGSTMGDTWRIDTKKGSTYTEAADTLILRCSGTKCSSSD